MTAPSDLKKIAEFLDAFQELMLDSDIKLDLHDASGDAQLLISVRKDDPAAGTFGVTNVRYTEEGGMPAIKFQQDILRSEEE